MVLRYPLDLNTSDVDYVAFKYLKYSEASAPGAGGDIILYMPASTPTVVNDNDWGAKSFDGPLGQLTKTAASGAANIASDAFTDGGTGKTIDEFKKMMSSAGDNAGGALRQLGVQTAAGMANMSANQLLSVSRGEIYNPNIELLYAGPKVRGFNFNYTFVPKNSAEASAAAKIVKEFKIWSSPKLLETGMFEIPYVWQVSYMTGGSLNANMNCFKKAALTSIGLQHNPGLPMHMSHTNGMPIVTQLSLSFMEADVIIRQDQEASPSNFGY